MHLEKLSHQSKKIQLRKEQISSVSSFRLSSPEDGSTSSPEDGSTRRYWLIGIQYGEN
jgi:hypothetical protein